jgi:predicted metal-dependent enzyme (double-stranded beta helix superfamily)
MTNDKGQRTIDHKLLLGSLYFMEVHDWLVTEDGQIQRLDSLDIYQNRQPSEYYRVYHFLSDIEKIVQHEPSDRERLRLICPLVRRLLMSSYWLQTTLRKPDPETGWSVVKLYDEPYFPWTVQNAVWLPGHSSGIHNHATWGIVALMAGEERNSLWKRVQHPDDENAVVKVGEHILTPGDLITFVPDAIHSIESLGDQPTITFNVYGETNGEVIYFNAVETP